MHKNREQRDALKTSHAVCASWLHASGIPPNAQECLWEGKREEVSETSFETNIFQGNQEANS